MDVKNLVRQTGFIDESADPNSQPWWWAAGHNDRWERFAALVLEEACAAVGRKWHTSVDECVAEIRALKPRSE